MNEEDAVKITCDVDFTSGLGEISEELSGKKMETTLTEEDCNFAMHYLSGQCEEQTAKGANVTELCDAILINYLRVQNLFTKDYPTDTERFNTVLEEYNQRKALEEQERAQEKAQEEANTPSWTKELEE